MPRSISELKRTWLGQSSLTVHLVRSLGHGRKNSETYCGRKITGEIVDPVTGNEEYVCRTCRAAARSWGYR